MTVGLTVDDADIDTDGVWELVALAVNDIVGVGVTVAVTLAETDRETVDVTDEEPVFDGVVVILEVAESE